MPESLVHMSICDDASTMILLVNHIDIAYDIYEEFGYIYVVFDLEVQESIYKLTAVRTVILVSHSCNSNQYIHFTKQAAKLWNGSLVSDRHYYSTIQQIMESVPDPRGIGLPPEKNISPITASNYIKNESKITYIPSWFKTPSLYWHQEKIIDTEYFDSIEYLIESGIIIIET